MNGEVKMRNGHEDDVRKVEKERGGKEGIQISWQNLTVRTSEKEKERFSVGERESFIESGLRDPPSGNVT